MSTSQQPSAPATTSSCPRPPKAQSRAAIHAMLESAEWLDDGRLRCTFRCTQTQRIVISTTEPARSPLPALWNAKHPWLRSFLFRVWRPSLRFGWALWDLWVSRRRQLATVEAAFVKVRGQFEWVVDEGTWRIPDSH